MKTHARQTARRNMSNMGAVITVILLLMPSSSSVLCIAPGGHMAIEDINALCCLSSVVSAPSSRHLDVTFGPAGDCRDCTDFYMTPDYMTSNNRGVVAASSCIVTSDSPSGECCTSRLLGDTPPSSRRPSVFNIGDIPPIFIASSIPLLC